MDPTFTDSKTHDRKGKWSKPHKASRHDKRGPRLDIVPDYMEDAEEITSAAASAVAPSAPVLTCQNPHPSLSNLYQAHGYRGYLDYVNTEYCESCSTCKTQKAANTAWMVKHAEAIDEAEGVFVATGGRSRSKPPASSAEAAVRLSGDSLSEVGRQPPAPVLEAIYAKSGYDGIAETLEEPYYCTDCSVCRVQHAANNRWLAANRALLAKEKAEYDDKMLEAKEREQDRRKWYDWEYRTRRY